MPTVTILDGIEIKLYWDDHRPAHFHAEYGEYSAGISIDSLRMINGSMPLRNFERLSHGPSHEKNNCAPRGSSARRTVTPEKSREEAAAHRIGRANH